MEKQWTMLGARIPPDLHKALKMAAVELERPLADLVEEALRDLLRKYRREVPHG